MSVRTPVVSAYLMQVVCLLLHIRSDTNGLCVREASLSISANVMQVVYHFCVLVQAPMVSAYVMQVACHLLHFGFLQM